MAKEIESDWNELSKELKSFQATHKEYLAKLDELVSLEGTCNGKLKHFHYRLGKLKDEVERQSNVFGKDELKVMRDGFRRQETQLQEIEQSLPRESGLYLKIILGSVNVSILNKEERFKYKEEYEKFKLTVTAIGLVLSAFNLFWNIRVMDLILMFLLVWYYCTLTIREGILQVNGSKIKGWWVTHHFIATVMSGIFVVWPDGELYQEFRTQYMAFTCYICFVQYLQFTYQTGCLYRLKALGSRHSMDITNEGFFSWMWRGLSFLLPFLYIGYFFQFHNSFTLFYLSRDRKAPWQVFALCVLFGVVAFGNTVTTTMVIFYRFFEDIDFLNSRVRRLISPRKRETTAEKPSTKAEKSD